MSWVFESEVDISLQEGRGGVQILSLLGSTQCRSEHGEPLEGDRLEDSPAIGEVVVRRLMAHARCGGDLS